MYVINDFKKMEGDKSLRGFIDLYDTVHKCLIPGFTLFHSKGRYWINPPSRTYVNDEGEKKYVKLMVMNREDQDAFTKNILLQLKTYNPNAPKPFEYKKTEPKDDQMDLPF